MKTKHPVPSPCPCCYLISKSKENPTRTEPIATRGPAGHSRQPKSGFWLPTSGPLLYFFCSGFITWVEMELQLLPPKLSQEPRAVNASWGRKHGDTPRNRMEEPRVASSSSTSCRHRHSYGRRVGGAEGGGCTYSVRNPQWHRQVAHNTESHSHSPLRWKSEGAQTPGVKRNWCPLLGLLSLVLQPCTGHFSCLWLSCLSCRIWRYL